MKSREWVKISRQMNLIISFIHSLKQMPDIIAGETQNIMFKWSFHIFQEANEQTNEINNITLGNNKYYKILSNNGE